MKTEEVIHHLTSEAERCDRLANAAERRSRQYRALAESCAAAAEALGARPGNGNGNKTERRAAR